MKRLPLVFSLLAVIALSSSIAYWVITLYQFKQRPQAPLVEASLPEPSPDAAATLFGGQAVVATVSNYRLTGVVAAGRDSAAILVADGQPPKALKMGAEVAPGVTVREVHARYVMLAEGGVLKRIDLAADDKAAATMGLPATDPNQAQQQQPQPQPMQPPEAQGQNNNTPMEVPSNLPGQMPANLPGQMPALIPPPPPAVQMPAPTRNFSNPGAGGQPPTQ